jgi:hypothetical protein
MHNMYFWCVSHIAQFGRIEKSFSLIILKMESFMESDFFQLKINVSLLSIKFLRNRIWSGRLWNVPTMVYNTQNDWGFGLYPLPGIPKDTTEHIVPETGPVCNRLTPNPRLRQWTKSKFPNRCVLYPCRVHPVALCTRISFKCIPAIATENLLV